MDQAITAENAVTKRLSSICLSTVLPFWKGQMADIAGLGGNIEVDIVRHRANKKQPRSRDHIMKLQMHQTMKTATALLLLAFGFLLAPLSLSAQEEQPNVSVSAELVVGDNNTHGELIVTANIKEGLHIYAQSQPKPFLATRFTVEENPQVQVTGEFVAERAPILLTHESLGAQLHEFEGTIRWKAPVTISNDADLNNLTISGSVFAQACEAERCFAPETLAFSAMVHPSAPLAEINSEPSEELAIISLPPMESSNSEQPIVLDPTLDAVATAAEEQPAFDLENLKTQTDTKSELSIVAVLPLAFVAGFILNFMPCVLPVVGLKVLSFVQQAKNSRRRIFMLNLAYALGTISVLLVLATLATFAGLGWGEQFSSVTFTVVLSSIVFAFALSFLGVWHIALPGFVDNLNGNEEGLPGAFSKGILSTVLATPCSGPFLGSALAWALVQPAWVTYIVFGTVGLGMASPFLAIGVFPQLVKWLPKPGPWMESFKQLMGFVLIGTVIFLLSFISIPALVPTLALLSGIGLATWFYGRGKSLSRNDSWKRLAAATGIVMLTTWFSFGWLYDISEQRFERAAARFVESRSGEIAALQSNEIATEGEIPWQSYSEEALQSAIASGKTVFVDFTADWCLTCKTNETVAIDKPEVAKLIEDQMIVALRADKTEPAPEVERLLRQLGNQSASIPFYAVFPKDDPGSPITLDGILSSSAPIIESLVSQGSSSISQ